MRLLPHDQNTGGFFVCILEKLGRPSEPSEMTSTATNLPPVQPLDNVMIADESGSSSLKRAAAPSMPTTDSATKRPKTEQRKPKRDLGFKEDPYSFLDPSNPELQSIS